jgi:NAD(P)-dependent dehydrogenase (short-subunit alcohol dehydrogenase family)
MEITSILVWSFISITVLFLLHKFFNGPMTSLGKNINLTNKIIVVTGANAGIGKEAAFALLEKGAKVIFACRDEIRTNKLINSISNLKLRGNAYFINLDLANFRSIKSFVKEFQLRFGKLDILINNAGGNFDKYSDRFGIETTMLTNHIGPVYLTNLLIDNFKHQAKIINVSSYAHYFCTKSIIDDWVFDKVNKNNYKFWSMYSLSKMANIAHTKHLNNLFKEKDLSIKAAALHPGTVRTEFFQKYESFIMKFLTVLTKPISYLFFKGPVEGAQTTLHLVYLEYEDYVSGGYYSDCKVKNTNELVRNSHAMDKIMRKTNDIIDNYLSNWGSE